MIVSGIVSLMKVVQLFVLKFKDNNVDLRVYIKDVIILLGSLIFVLL